MAVHCARTVPPIFPLALFWESSVFIPSLDQHSLVGTPIFYAGYLLIKYFFDLVLLEISPLLYTFSYQIYLG